MPNEDFWSVIGGILKSLPPTMAGVVLMALALAVLAYSWRRATDEAKREKAKADNSAADLDKHKLDAILHIVTSSAERIAEIQTISEVLKDRGKR